MSFYKIFFLSIFIILPIKVYPINSISKDINIISSGLELYKKKCSNCHGVNAQGKSNGFFLSPNLTVFQKGYINFINIIVNGYGRMPAWGGNVELTKEQINQLASYLASISTEEANWQ